MADHGILFSAPMVLALLEGRKTQTRRLANFIQPDGDGWHIRTPAGGGFFGADTDAVLTYGGDYAPRVLGDRLWVREAASAVELKNGADVVCYAADKTWRAIDNSPEAADRWMAMHNYARKKGALVPSIHMPRWASRLTLIVTGVKVERLQSISKADCVAEGHPRAPAPLPAEVHLDAARDWYEDLWIKLHGLASWQSNPWVVAYRFDVLKGNIDKVRR